MRLYVSDGWVDLPEITCMAVQTFEQVSTYELENGGKLNIVRLDRDDMLPWQFQYYPPSAVQPAIMVTLTQEQRDRFYNETEVPTLAASFDDPM